MTFILLTVQFVIAFTLIGVGTFPSAHLKMAFDVWVFLGVCAAAWEVFHKGNNRM